MISQAFTIHRTEGEWGSYLVNSFLPPPPVLQTLRISWLVTLEISSLHITSSRTRTRNVLVCECKSLTTTLHALKCASVFNFDYIYLLSHIVLQPKRSEILSYIGYPKNLKYLFHQVKQSWYYMKYVFTSSKTTTL